MTPVKLDAKIQPEEFQNDSDAKQPVENQRVAEILTNER